MHPSPVLQWPDYVGPIIGSLVFIAGMSRVPEPQRKTLNAVLVIGASGVYLSGGFGGWELLYALVAGPCLGYIALRSYYAIGIAWLMHAGWDWLHHLYGSAIWPFMPSSSFGCMLFDTCIAVWFLAGAPPHASRVSRTVQTSESVARF
jgi:hypothetical protein